MSIICSLDPDLVKTDEIGLHLFNFEQRAKIVRVPVIGWHIYMVF